MMEHIKKLNDGEKSQEETFKKLKNDNKLLENKLEQIHKETSKFLGVKNPCCQKMNKHRSNPHHSSRRCQSN